MTYVEKLAMLLYLFIMIAGGIAVGEFVTEAITGDVIGRDSTDPEHSHSGLKRMVDAMTGCEYLATPWGGITPRMTDQGKQWCGSQKREP